jgi:hypothetical protein
VCRPGSKIGLVSWTPEGFVGQMFAAVKPYSSPPPRGSQPPPLWGDEDHVRSLFGDQVVNILTPRRMVTVDLFEKPAAFRDYFKAKYGPTVSAYRGLANEPERIAALDQDFADLARQHDRGTATTVMDWEYLLLSAPQERRGRRVGMSGPADQWTLGCIR